MKSYSFFKSIVFLLMELFFLKEKFGWYSCDGLITDRHDGREMEGHPMASAGYISVLNPNSKETADVTITFYHQNVEPTSICIKVPILGMEVVEVHNIEESGERNKYYGPKVFASLTPLDMGREFSIAEPSCPCLTGLTDDFVLREGNIPIIAQHTTYEYKAWDRVPEGMISVVMHPGPLKSETEWYFPDSWMGVHQRRSVLWWRGKDVLVRTRNHDYFES